MDIGLIIGITGSIASIISIPIAIYQSYKSRRMKIEQEMIIWQRIETIKSIIRAFSSKENDFAKGLIQELYRNLLKDAILMEEKFDLSTLESWRKVGKISSNWQERNALMMLNTKNIPKDYSTSYSNFDEDIKTNSRVDLNNEMPLNCEQIGLCCFVLDVSGSMSGAPINELNIGIERFLKEIEMDPIVSKRLEIAIIEYNSSVKIVISPTKVENIKTPILSAKGTNKIAEGVNEAIAIVEDRCNWYKQTGQPYLRPWIILISNGAFDSDQNVEKLASNIKERTKDKKFIFLPIGVQGADMDVLSKISGNEMQAMKLEGLKFSDFFKWMSASMSIITNASDGEINNLPDPSEWMAGFRI